MAAITSATPQCSHINGFDNFTTDHVEALVGFDNYAKTTFPIAAITGFDNTVHALWSAI